MHKKDAIVIHSGGMDSSLCLALAIREFTAQRVLSLSFSYQQKASNELEQADFICREWGVDHALIDVKCLALLTSNAITDSSIPLNWKEGEEPPSLVMGRNGLMAHLGGIHAHELGASCIYMGVLEEEAEEIGYRDCSEEYIRLKEKSLQIDLANPHFEIRTPLIHMRKEQTLQLAHELGILDFLWENTISCYEGMPREGCQRCPACFLRNRGLARFKGLSTNKN